MSRKRNVHLSSTLRGHPLSTSGHPHQGQHSGHHSPVLEPKGPPMHCPQHLKQNDGFNPHSTDERPRKETGLQCSWSPTYGPLGSHITDCGTRGAGFWFTLGRRLGVPRCLLLGLPLWLLFFLPLGLPAPHPSTRSFIRRSRPRGTGPSPNRIAGGEGGRQCVMLEPELGQPALCSEEPPLQGRMSVPPPSRIITGISCYGCPYPIPWGQTLPPMATWHTLHP